MSNLKIVTVVNNLNIFDECIKNNENLKSFEIIKFDNTVENIGISKRYNTFIKDRINENSDFWVAFIHQDFVFEENPFEKLKNLPKDCIYGVIGVARKFFYLQWEPKFTVTINKRLVLGQIYEKETECFVGTKVLNNPEVKTVDCCCMIVHSSLLYKENMLFDENLDFHMYAEDFCITARKRKHVKTKICQFNCIHLSHGALNEALENSALYVKKKHNLSKINSLCYK